MTSHVARLYALVAGVVAFFVAWAAVAAHPWSTPTKAASDPRLTTLAAREQQIRSESIRVQKVVAARWAIYRRALAAHNAAVSKAQVAATQPATLSTPAVRVVNLPPLVVTRVS